MSKEAIDITQIHVLGNKMFFQSKEVKYKLPHNALEDFISFLSTFPEKPLLVGHNIKRFDCHVLYNALKSRHMWNEFSNHVCGFLDTLDLFKETHPGLSSYTQTSLVQALLPGQSFMAHNANDDASTLLQLIEKKSQLNEARVKQFSFPCSYCSDFQLERKNLETFSEAINAEAISKAIATKAARSNLKFSHLRLAVERDGIDGLHALMSEPTKFGKPSVTSCCKEDFCFPDSGMLRTVVHVFSHVTCTYARYVVHLAIPCNF